LFALFFYELKKAPYICRQGEMAEWSNAAVLKTVEGHTSGGSNPSFSAKNPESVCFQGFIFWQNLNLFWLKHTDHGHKV
jgi:hypothetical protein